MKIGNLVSYFELWNAYNRKNIELYFWSEADKKINEISFFEIEDIFFEKRIKLFFKKKNIKFNEIKSPMFVTSRIEFKNYLESTKKPFMANFYKINRSKFDILMNKDGTPKGGKWSFDEENRKKLPDKVKIPKHIKLKHTSHTEELSKFIEANFKNHPGSTNNFWFPTTREQSQKLLDQFLKDKLNLFGDYELSLIHISEPTRPERIGYAGVGL